MNSPPFCSLKSPSMAISLSLLLVLLLSFCGWSFLSTLLLLALPSSFRFLFSKIKKFLQTGSMAKPTPEPKLGSETAVEDKVFSEEKKAINEGGKEKNSELVLKTLNSDWMILDSPNANEELECLDCNQLARPECMISDKEPAQDIVCSEGSISDDESLIEIALEEESHTLFHDQESSKGFMPDPLLDFSLELVFRQHGLLELLSEINEEDNMIEIDIAMGSIKCSRFEIKA